MYNSYKDTKYLRYEDEELSSYCRWATERWVSEIEPARVKE